MLAQTIPVSTILLTRNSMASLARYFASMQSIEDIIVLDGGSTDGTQELVRRQPNCRLYQQDKIFLDHQGYIKDFSGVRNQGYALARHPWILCIDADEEMSESLLAQIREIVAQAEPAIYYVRRRFTLNGKMVVVLGGSTSDQVRLFHRSCVTGCVRPVHERLDILPGSPRKYLDADIIVPLGTASSLRRKYDRYLAIEVMASDTIAFRRWFRWIFLRNIVAIMRRIMVIVAVRLIPATGPRYPLRLEWEQIRYSWLLLVRCCPIKFF